MHVTIYSRFGWVPKGYEGANEVQLLVLWTRRLSIFSLACVRYKWLSA